MSKQAKESNDWKQAAKRRATADYNASPAGKAAKARYRARQRAKARRPAPLRSAWTDAPPTEGAENV
jgi:hypothetical protein